MPPVPILRPRDVIRVFEHFGWYVARQRGSHIIMTKPGSITTLSIPNHSTIAKGTLRSLILKAGLTVDEFLEAL